MYLFSVSGFNIRREIQSTEEQLINHLERIAFASMMSQKLIDHCQETGKRNQEPGNKGTQREGMGRKKNQINAALPADRKRRIHFPIDLPT